MSLNAQTLCVEYVDNMRREHDDETTTMMITMMMMMMMTVIAVAVRLLYGAVRKISRALKN